MHIGWSRFADQWELTCLEDDGLRIDFERLADRGLSSSERARHQEALRELEHRLTSCASTGCTSRVKVTYLGLRTGAPLA